MLVASSPDMLIMGYAYRHSWHCFMIPFRQNGVHSQLPIYSVCGIVTAIVMMCAIEHHIGCAHTIHVDALFPSYSTQLHRLDCFHVTAFPYHMLQPGDIDLSGSVHVGQSRSSCHSK